MSNCATLAHTPPTIEERLDRLERAFDEMEKQIDGLMVVAAKLADQQKGAGQ